MSTATDPAQPASASPATPAAELSRARVVAATLALALGGFTIGTTEFATMGVLPQIAAGVGVTIPQAGHVVSAYALGVVVGAPLLAFVGARFPRRGLLLALMGCYALGNALSALVSRYDLLMLTRFLAGLPHGAYFGFASLAAASLVSPRLRGRAVASVMLGLSVANVLGVPAATWLGQGLGWRSTFLAAAGLAVATVLAVGLLLPPTPRDPHGTGRRELAGFARPQVWLTLLIGALGTGGMFAVYSYIAPLVTEVAGLPEPTVPFFLLSFGLGMVCGTWLAGELSAHSVTGSIAAGMALSVLMLLGIYALAPAGWWLLPMPFLLTSVFGLVTINLQLRLMDVAGEAKSVGAAMNHASLNVANALGAWVGGLVIAAGWGLRAPALVGAALSVLGLALLGVATRAAVPAASSSPDACDVHPL